MSARAIPGVTELGDRHNRYKVLRGRAYYAKDEKFRVLDG